MTDGESARERLTAALRRLERAVESRASAGVEDDDIAELEELRRERDELTEEVEMQRLARRELERRVRERDEEIARLRAATEVVSDRLDGTIDRIKLAMGQ
ncbi:hypothetical protein [Oceanibacterium hippocampi]|uniref:DUF4164 family protein n=1 Tax=Oceanibacterium hippocampi TaxID=745714 RepID=A0A1Y5TUN9_9PROT|nr:hypothetical protein [Oceanibacterium hippocampi]SLN73442.1 hypothetical protein OCH7691_03604 [Oceanibacterium hippocampi]